MPIYSSTITDLITNKMPQPYYRFDGDNNHIRFTAQTFDVANHSASFYFVARVDDTSVADIAIGYWSDYYKNHIRINSNATISFDTNTNNMEAIGNLIRDDTDWHSYCVVCEDSKAIIYQDGVLLTLGTDDTFTDVVKFDEIGYGSIYGWFGGSISTVKLFNTALSGDEVQDLGAGGSVPYIYKGASQTDFASGWSFSSGWAIYTGTINDADTFTTTGAGGAYHNTLFSNTVGKRYRYHVVGTTTASSINFYPGSSGGLMHGEGTGAFDATFEYTHIVGSQGGFYARNGVAGETTITTITITQIGAVLEYDGSGATSATWYDKSGNGIHGTVNGATLENAPSDTSIVPSYETGTWTPTGLGSANWGTASGTYTKIGTMVICSGTLVAGATGANDGIGGFPFTCGDQNGVGTGYEQNNTGHTIQARVNANATVGHIRQHENGNSWGSGDNCYFTVCYSTA